MENIIKLKHVQRLTDQAVHDMHPYNLISIHFHFEEALCMIGSLITHLRLWPGYFAAQADMSLCWTLMSFCKVCCGPFISLQQLSTYQCFPPECVCVVGEEGSGEGGILWAAKTATALGNLTNNLGKGAGSNMFQLENLKEIV